MERRSGVSAEVAVVVAAAAAAAAETGMQAVFTAGDGWAKVHGCVVGSR